MIVKICGVTVVEDGIAALEAGADMLGFNFYPHSPRFVSPEACRTLVSALLAHGPPFVAVGVFVDCAPGEVRRLMQQCGLHLAQLSGDEPPADLCEIGPGRAFKAIHCSGALAAESARQYAVTPGETRPALLLDAAAGPGQYGGTGLSADWRVAAGLAIDYPLLLAGGLRPDNVADAVRTVRPWGVDVASGVESRPGRKDPARMRAFIEAARSAAASHA